MIATPEPDTGEPDTGELLNRSAAGDVAARDRLLQRHRDRLRRMIAIRIDARVAARIDPSDVLQEALAEADAKLDSYLRDRPVAFYPWLRKIAWERLVKLHRRHIQSKRRSVEREEPIPLSAQYAAVLTERLCARGSTPSRQALQNESRARVRAALDALPETDREVLVMRNLEQLSVAETAEVLGLSTGAVKMRHVRALTRLQASLGGLSEGDR